MNKKSCEALKVTQIKILIYQNNLVLIQFQTINNTRLENRELSLKNDFSTKLLQPFY